MNLKVTILTCDISEFGRGNFNRSQTLHKFLNNRNISIELFVLSSVNDIQELRITEIFKSSKILIIDIPIDLQKFVPSDFLNHFAGVIALDWFSDFVPEYNIVIFNHKMPKSSIETYSGIEFAILNPELAEIAEKRTSKWEYDYLIALGASDIELGSRIHASLLLKKFNGILIETSEADEKKESLINTLKSPENFMELLVNSCVVITNGGMTAIESLSLGKQIIVFPMNAHEKNFVNYLNLEHANVHVGTSEIIGLMKLLIANPKNLEPNGTQTIGGGLEKIIEILHRMEVRN